jgi:hypothetical protein
MFVYIGIWCGASFSYKIQILYDKLWCIRVWEGVFINIIWNRLISCSCAINNPDYGFLFVRQ